MHHWLPGETCLPGVGQTDLLECLVGCADTDPVGCPSPFQVPWLGGLPPTGTRLKGTDSQLGQSPCEERSQLQAAPSPKTRPATVQAVIVSDPLTSKTTPATSPPAAKATFINNVSNA